MSRGSGRTLALLVFALATGTVRPSAEAERRELAGRSARAGTPAGAPPGGVVAQAAPRGASDARSRGAQTRAHGSRPVARAAAARAERLGLGDMKAAGNLLAGRAERAWVRAAGGGARLAGTLRFPVANGHVVRGFGSGKGGYHQAVDIAGELGSRVHAAAPGIVAYADDGVSGYGNMVILVHPGGQITTYAHNQKNLVVAGQRVRRGTLIAKLGSTGRSKGPHVHFELLFDGENCDPMPLFRPAARRRNGEPASAVLSVWKRADKRPASIQCHPRKHHPDYVDKKRAASEDDEEEAGDGEAP